jgi:fructokinase
MIVVAGEALIDLIDESGALRAHPGGGPFNTAVALGRLGVPVGFFGRLSSDRFGQLLESRLSESGVDGRYLLHGAAPSPLAVVHETADGDHEYAFYLAGTAYADITTADLPELTPDVVAVSAGTLGLGSDPPGESIEALIERESPTRLIIVDPNVRPAVFGDRDVYRRRFERCASFAHVVKLSDVDAHWLYPGESVEAIVEMLLAHGVRLVVLTRGADGALAKSRVDSASVGSPTVDVVDTVGAGDSFAAGLLRWLWVNDRLDAESVGTLDASALTNGLRFAAVVGALQCARAGATPPTLAEVDAFLDRRSRSITEV